VLEFFHPSRNGVRQNSINRFDCINYDLVKALDKIDTSIFLHNKNNNSVLISASPSLVPSSSPSNTEFQVENSVDHSITPSENDNDSNTIVDNNKNGNRFSMNQSFKPNMVVVPLSTILNSKTEILDSLIEEVSWLEICNFIVAITLILIVISLGFLFFDPHLIKSKNFGRKVIFIIRKCVNKFLIYFIKICNNFRDRVFRSNSNFHSAYVNYQNASLNTQGLSNIIFLSSNNSFSSNHINPINTFKPLLVTSSHVEFIKWNKAEKIIFKESLNNNSTLTIKSFRDLDNIDTNTFVQSIISYLDNASSFHSDFSSNNILPFQSNEYELLFRNNNSWTEMLAVKILDQNFNLELINISNILLMCDLCKSIFSEYLTPFSNNYNIIMVPSDDSVSKYYLFNRVNSINFNFIRIQFDLVSNKVRKVSLLYKSSDSGIIQCYSKECSEQNEGFDIPHFDVY
jgi:hypothetical protein